MLAQFSSWNIPLQIRKGYTKCWWEPLNFPSYTHDIGQHPSSQKSNFVNHANISNPLIQISNMVIVDQCVFWKLWRIK